MPAQYSASQIRDMNKTFPWTGCISNAKSLSECKQYYLHATGYCGISSGRIYVALPIDMKITSEVKDKYNLML